MNKRLHIGLIGGIGVAAALAYYQRLSRAVEGPLELTVVHAQVADLLTNSLADDRRAQAEIYARLIDRLRDAGADCAAITSLGGHFCFDETVSLSSLPLVSAVTPLDAYFQREDLGTVGLLGTARVMRTRLYGQLQRTRAVVPDEDLDTVGTAYQDLAIRGEAASGDAPFFQQAGRRLVTDQGAEAVVLAGTDLNLVFDGHDPGYRVIDALDVHVDVLARLAMGRMSLDDL
ncbi:aspartate/glutamate racemase family protein [Aestuariivita sp.]|jgi:aspartate racemase|uniref:aspartate/glutamate racemase family protein n=1 Tax=Aestuariivita sp. TaxID=1872407 RepID=UPI0021743A8F|nr:aspartate/glutamate racemase family protein [Aestuariivita sp.]MCE8008901.1 aspartate/glutamate racemase family protein [Aestuariivita sp.]